MKLGDFGETEENEGGASGGEKLIDYELLACDTHERRRVIRVKLVPVVSVAVGLWGLISGSIGLWWCGIFFCLVSILLAVNWKNAHGDNFFIFSLVVSAVTNIFLIEGRVEFGNTMLFSGVYFVFVWTFFHALMEIFEILKILNASFREGL